MLFPKKLHGNGILESLLVSRQEMVRQLPVVGFYGMLIVSTSMLVVLSFLETT
mgnify:CR=1 FL=1